MLFYGVILKLIWFKSNIQSEKFPPPDSHHIIILIAFVKASFGIPEGGLKVILSCLKQSDHHKEQSDLPDVGKRTNAWKAATGRRAT